MEAETIEAVIRASSLQRHPDRDSEVRYTGTGATKVEVTARSCPRGIYPLPRQFTLVAQATG